MNGILKKKFIALLLVGIFVISTLVVGLNYESLKDIFSEQKEVAPQDDPLVEEEDEVTKNVNNMLEQLDEETITEYIRKLTDFGPHPTARIIQSKLRRKNLPIEDVQEYIFNELKSMGYDVRYQQWAQETTISNLFKPKYSPGWFCGKNIEATLPGKEKNSDEIYVLQAHYDTWPGSPGADDDSSGVAAVLAAAKIMRQYEFNHTVRFLLVDGEEQGLLGTYAYAKEAEKNNDNIMAALCLDMIGNRGPNYRNTEILIGVNGQSNWIANYIIEVNSRYPMIFDFTIFQDNAEDYGSDHKAFIAHGFSAVHWAEGVFDDEDWHTPNDTLERMDIETATKNSKLALATIAEMAWDVEH